MSEYVKARALNAIKDSGVYRAPGTIWDCPSEQFKKLKAAEAVEEVVIDERDAGNETVVENMSREEIVSKIDFINAEFDLDVKYGKKESQESLGKKLLDAQAKIESR